MGKILPPTLETFDLPRMTVSLFEITGKRKLLLSYFLFSYHGSSFTEFRVLKPPGYNLFIRVFRAFKMKFIAINRPSRGFSQLLTLRS